MTGIVHTVAAILLISLAVQNASGSVRVSFSEAEYSEFEDVGRVCVTVMKEGVSSGMLTFTITSLSYNAFNSSGFVASAELQAKTLPSAAQSAATADQQRDFFTEFFNVQFSGSTDSLQVNLSFGIIPDDILESNEGFFVTLELDSSLSDPDTVQELTITRNTSLVQILNDDFVMVSFNAESFTVSEAEVNFHSLNSLISVELIGTSELEITVVVELLNGGSAELGVDYTTSPLPLTMTFIPGETTSFQIPFTVINDFIAEVDETFSLHIIGPPNPSVMYGFDVTTVTIINDDVLVFGLEYPEYTVGEEEGSVEVCVRIRAPNDTSVTGVALLSTMDGTALAPQDYEPILDSAVTVNAIEVRSCRNIAIVDDSDAGPPLIIKFTLQLMPYDGNFKQVVDHNTTTIIIVDNDGRSNSADNTVSEGSFIAALVVLLVIAIVLICIIVVLGLLLWYKQHKHSEKKCEQYSTQQYSMQQKESIPT